MKEHPIDKFMRGIRPAVIFAAYAALPIFLSSYGYAMYSLLMAAPAWVSVISVLSHITVFLGIAGLIDIQSERQRWSEDGR